MTVILGQWYLAGSSSEQKPAGPTLRSSSVYWDPMTVLCSKGRETWRVPYMFSGPETLLSLSLSHHTLPRGPKGSVSRKAEKSRKKQNLHQKGRDGYSPTHWISASVPGERQIHTHTHTYKNHSHIMQKSNY